jgi:phosphoribosylamine--glycine ligase
MKALVLGSGGREHALAWKLAQSPLVQTVYVAPGNGGTATDNRLENIPITDVVTLREWAQNAQIDITVVGPEALLAAGVVDEFRAHGLRIFGPTQAAAQLESSKAFSKDFMRRHGIPTARHETFTDATLAHRYVESLGVPIVVKADGLAAGKGVVVATTLDQAHQAPLPGPRGGFPQPPTGDEIRPETGPGYSLAGPLVDQINKSGPLNN